MKILYPLLSLLVVASSVFGQNAGDYQSHQSGPWNDVNSWEQYDGVSFVFPSPTTPTSTDGVITNILSGHTITVTADETINQTTINSGGAIVINSGVTLFMDEDFSNIPLTIASGATLTVTGTLDAASLLIISPVTVNGTINSTGVVSSGDYSLMVFNSNSTYRHQNLTGGAIPLATWATDSNCIINGLSAASPAVPSNLGQAFGNFIWNCTSQGATVGVFSLGGLLTNVQGSLTFQSSNSRAIRLNNAGPGYSLVVGVDLINLGVPVVLSSASTSGATTVTVTRDCSLSGGSLTFKAASNFDAKLFVGRNFSRTAGSFAGGTGTGIATLSFNGGVAQSYTMVGTVSNINYEIINNSTLNTGTSAISGSGSFTLSTGSLLGVGSTDASGAIQLAPSTQGNVTVTGTRTYQSGTTIVYNGAAAQVIGNGHPTTAGVDITIANPSGVSIIAPTTLAGTINLLSGNLNIGTSSLTITGGITGANKISIGSAGSLSIGGSSNIGTFPFTSGAQTFTNFTLNNTNGITFGNDVTISGVTTLTNGTLTFNGTSLSMNGTFSATSGVLSGDLSSTLTIGGSGAFGTLAVSPGSTIGTLTFNRSGGTADINSSLIIATALNLLNGDFTNTSGLQVGNGATLTRRSGSQLLLNAPVNLPANQFYHVVYTGGALTTGLELPSVADNMLGNLTISGGPVTLSSDIKVKGNVTLSSSTFDANGKNITLSSTSGTWNKASGSFTGGTGTVIVDNTAHNSNYTITASSTPTFTNLSVPSGNILTLPSGSINISGNVANSGTINPGTSTVNFNGATTISGAATTSLSNVTISGTLTAPSSSLNIAGDFVNNGTFTHSNGTVVFNGTSTISGSSSPSFFAVTISGTLTAPSGTLNVAGNFTNSGTFNNNSGTVAFNGTVSTQSISGSAITFNNINVSNPVGVGVNSTARLNGTLTLGASGVFDADGAGSGTFIISSTSQNTGGMIAALPTPANFVGNVTVERYIHSQAGGDYRYLAMPITNGNVSMLKSSIFVTGNFSDRSTHADNANIVDSGNTNASVFSYNSTTQAYVGISGGGGLTSATPLSNTVGYSAYDFNDGAVTGSFRGTIGKGNVAVTISSTTNNFNLVPNPYPSPIDWDNVTKTNVNNAMYLRVTNNVFSSYVGGIVTNAPFVGWTGEIATGQSFFTTSSGAGSTLTFKETDKTSNSYTFLRQASPDNYFRIALSSASGQRDEMVIHFVDGATDGIDSEFDAVKIKNGNHVSPLLGQNEYVNISSYLNKSEEFAVNSLAKLTGPRTVNLNVSEVRVGMHTLSFSDLGTMSLGYRIELIDNYLNRVTEVTDKSSYDFTVDANKQSYGSERFYLRINGVGVVTGLENSLFEMKVYPNPVSDKLMIQLSKDQETNLRRIVLLDVLGNEMISSESNQWLLTPGTKVIDMSGYSTGIYVLNVHYGETSRSTRVVKK